VPLVVQPVVVPLSKPMLVAAWAGTAASKAIAGMRSIFMATLFPFSVLGLCG
jgi:hypothetical protein